MDDIHLPFWDSETLRGKLRVASDRPGRIQVSPRSRVSMIMMNSIIVKILKKVAHFHKNKIVYRAVRLLSTF